MLIRKILLPLTLAALLAGAAGYWILTNPDNPLTRHFQRQISDTSARIVIGPYPTERDFRLLKANGINTVVSLLDSNIPYERVLFEREKEVAARSQITVLNFPMSSILGQQFGAYTKQNAAKAADAIAALDEKVYLHCYLGLHRIQVVRDLLTAKGISAGTYAVRQGERALNTRQLDTAQAAYDAGDYQKALDTISQLDQLPPSARLLQAWSHYRLGKVAEARGLFGAYLAAEPDNGPAALGLGYCDLRDGDLAAAEKRFGEVLARTPKDAEALGGMGLACYRAGHMDDAVRYLEQALLVVPGNQELRDVLASARARR